MKKIFSKKNFKIELNWE